MDYTYYRLRLFSGEDDDLSTPTSLQQTVFYRPIEQL